MVYTKWKDETCPLCDRPYRAVCDMWGEPLCGVCGDCENHNAIATPPDIDPDYENALADQGK